MVRKLDSAADLLRSTFGAHRAREDALRHQREMIEPALEVVVEEVLLHGFRTSSKALRAAGEKIEETHALLDRGRQTLENCSDHLVGRDAFGLALEVEEHTMPERWQRRLLDVLEAGCEPSVEKR